MRLRLIALLPAETPTLKLLRGLSPDNASLVTIVSTSAEQFKRIVEIDLLKKELSPRSSLVNTI